MIISEINDKNIWENFLLGCQEKTFVDSWSWGEFQIKMGNSDKGGSAEGGKIWRLGVFDGEKLI